MKHRLIDPTPPSEFGIGLAIVCVVFLLWLVFGG